MPLWYYSECTHCIITHGMAPVGIERTVIRTCVRRIYRVSKKKLMPFIFKLAVNILPT